MGEPTAEPKRERRGDRRSPAVGSVDRGSSLAIPGYRAVWITGLLWHVARSMALFGTTFRVTEQTGDPLLVQLVGTAFMAPMFLGGVLAGAVSDRFDRHRTVRLGIGVLTPLAGLMALAVSADQAPVALSYLFVFLVGLGNVIDMTSRRSIAFGLAGAGLLTNAAALESFALHAGNMTGSVVAGTVLEAISMPAVYIGVAIAYVVATLIFESSRKHQHQQATEPVVDAPGSTAGEDLRAAFGLLRTNVVLRQFLVTTVLMNFFYYAFTPLIPVFAERLGVGAFYTGLLAAAIGLGTMAGALVLARVQPARRGRIHVAGALGAMIMLVIFANLTWYPAAIAALLVAGFVGSGFSTTQSALVVTLAGDELRGRALGVLSMAIGALPFGMFSLGLIARRTDPQRALTLSVTVGIAILVGWQAARPHLRRLS